MALNTLFHDISWNLDTIKSITNHQTLLVVGDKLNLDDRYIQSIRRSFTFDSRKQILQVIEKTLVSTRELLISYQHSTYLQQSSSTHVYQEQIDVAENIYANVQELLHKKDGVLQGLQILATFERYTKDTAFQIKIQNFSKHVQSLHQKCLQLKQRYEKLQHLDQRYHSRKKNATSQQHMAAKSR